MRNTDAFSFLTPPPKIEARTKRNTTFSNVNTSNSKYLFSERRSIPRKPIFTQNKSLMRNTLNFSTNSVNIMKKQLYENKNIIYDFCGCENQIIPCEIIQITFLKKVSKQEMKNQAVQIAERQNLSETIRRNHQKSLFRTLPKSYPELFFTQLTNILNLLDENTTWAEFCCLSWIQYHSKVQYITYFLYKDLKESFTKKNQFIGNISDEILKKGNNFQSFKTAFLGKGYEDIFENFLNDQLL